MFFPGLTGTNWDKPGEGLGTWDFNGFQDIKSHFDIYFDDMSHDMSKRIEGFHLDNWRSCGNCGYWETKQITHDQLHGILIWSNRYLMTVQR